MNSTKKPLYKKKYHAAHQLYPKTRGGAQLCAPPPTPGAGGRSSPVPTPTPLARKKGGEGLPSAVGYPSPQHGGGTPWHGPGPRAQSVLGTPRGPTREEGGAPGPAPPTREAQACGETRVRAANAVLLFPPPPAPKRCLSPCRHTEGGEASMWGQSSPGGSPRELQVPSPALARLRGAPKSQIPGAGRFRIWGGSRGSAPTAPQPCAGLSPGQHPRVRARLGHPGVGGHTCSGARLWAGVGGGRRRRRGALSHERAA